MPSVTSSAGAGATDGGAGSIWGTPSNITASDSLKANCTMSDALGNVGEGLRATSFDFSVIPTGSRIRGYEASVERACNSQTSSPRDETIQLLKNLVAVGDNKASASTWPLTDVVATYGGALDTWNADFTLAELSTIGLLVRTQRTAGAGSNIVAVDHVQLTVHYDEPEPKLRYTRRPHLTLPGGQQPNLR